MSEGKLSCASSEMIALPHLSDLALCSTAGKGPNGELAYSRCASWEHGNMGALGQEGSVGCADRLQRKFGRGHGGEPDEVESYYSLVTSS